MPKKKSDPIDAIRGKLPKQERRTYQGEISLRAEGDNPTIGMFVPFGRRSVELWGFVEIIEPSAFTKTLQERGGDIVSVWNHDPNWVLGRQSNKTLALREADDGLHGDVPLGGEDAMHQPFAPPRRAPGCDRDVVRVRDRAGRLGHGTRWHGS